MNHYVLSRNWVLFLRGNLLWVLMLSSSTTRDGVVRRVPVLYPVLLSRQLNGGILTRAVFPQGCRGSYGRENSVLTCQGNGNLAVMRTVRCGHRWLQDKCWVNSVSPNLTGVQILQRNWSSLLWSSCSETELKQVLILALSFPRYVDAGNDLASLFLGGQAKCTGMQGVVQINMMNANYSGMTYVSTPRILVTIVVSRFSICSVGAQYGRGRNWHHPESL